MRDNGFETKSDLTWILCLRTHYYDAMVEDQWNNIIYIIISIGPKSVSNHTHTRLLQPQHRITFVLCHTRIVLIDNQHTILQFCNIRLRCGSVYTILPAVVILFIFHPVCCFVADAHARTRCRCHSSTAQSVTKIITDFNGATRTRLCCYYYIIIWYMRKEQKNTILLVAGSPTARCDCRTHTHWTRFPWGIACTTRKRRFFRSFTRVIRYTLRGFWAPSANLRVEKSGNVSCTAWWCVLVKSYKPIQYI